MKLLIVVLTLVTSSMSVASVLTTGDYDKFSDKNSWGEIPKNTSEYKARFGISKQGDSYGILDRKNNRTYSFTVGGANSMFRYDLLDKYRNDPDALTVVKMIESAWVSDAKEDLDKLSFTLNIKLNIDSVFGNGSVTLSSDFVLIGGSTCTFENHLLKTNEEGYDDWVTVKKSTTCLKLRSFLNTRVTDIETPFDAAYTKLIGFTSDVVVRTLLGGATKSEYLVKAK